MTFKETNVFFDCKLIETVTDEKRMEEILKDAKKRKLRVVMDYGLQFNSLSLFSYGEPEKPQGFKTLIAALKEMSK